MMISDEKDFKSKITESERLEKFKYTTNKVDVLTRDYTNYINILNQSFRDEWKKSRDVDRALWVYGHLFSGS